MEINKTNETFNLKDTTDAGWNIYGTATNNADGSLYINLNVDSTDESDVNSSLGYYSINTPTNGMYSVNITVLPEYYLALTNYAETAINAIKEYINNQTSSEE
jgi:hypothetical protein